MMGRWAMYLSGIVVGFLVGYCAAAIRRINTQKQNQKQTQALILALEQSRLEHQVTQRELWGRS